MEPIQKQGEHTDKKAPSPGMEPTTFPLWGDTASHCTGDGSPLSKQTGWDSDFAHTEQHVLHPCYFVSWPDRPVAPLAKSLCNALLGIRAFAQFLCNIRSELPTQAVTSAAPDTVRDLVECSSSSHADPSEEKCSERPQGGHRSPPCGCLMLQPACEQLMLLRF